MKKEDTRKSEHQKTQKQKKGIAFIAVAAVCLAVVAWIASRYAIAKYFAYRSEKGITIASAFYFNSNKLSKMELPGPATEDWVVNNMSIVGIPVTVNQDKWTGGDCIFSVEVRNFDNNLLYNEAGLDVGYVIYFRLVGTPQGASYTITSSEDNITLLDSHSGASRRSLETDGDIVKCKGTLKSGSAMSDVYDIRIDTTGAATKYDNDEAAKVVVVAYPTSPSYIVNDTASEHRLVGVFQAKISEPNMTIESSQFEIQATDSYKTDWRTVVNTQAGLIYNIQTGGDALVDENNSIQQTAYVKWKGDYLEISKYDSYFLTATENAKKAYDAVITAGGSTAEAKTAARKWYTGGDYKETGDEWVQMKIETLPNTEIDITFYKTSTFLNKIARMEKEQFEKLVTAEIPTTE